ncbi:hypothetical protein YB2330_001329 [Saitoella coloradoensis]
MSLDQPSTAETLGLLDSAAQKVATAASSAASAIRKASVDMSSSPDEVAKTMKEKLSMTTEKVQESASTLMGTAATTLRTAASSIIPQPEPSTSLDIFAAALSLNLATTSFSGHLILRPLPNTPPFVPNPRDILNTINTHMPPAGLTYHRARILPGKRVSNHEPLAVAYCMSTEDVQTVMKAYSDARNAVGEKPKVNVRSGGHSYEGLSCETDAVVVDVSAINHIEPVAVGESVGNEEHGAVVKVGAGIKTGKLYHRIGQLNKEYPDKGYGLDFAAGVCPTVGAAGLVLGGGYGFLARKFGLASDHLLAATLVTADGKVVRVSQDSTGNEKELFWALRGAGGGMAGVVTELELGLVKVPEMLTVIRIEYPFEQSLKIMEAYENNLPDMDERLTTQLTFVGNSPAVFQGKFLGAPTDAVKLLRECPFLDGSLEPLHMDFVHCPPAEANTKLSLEDPHITNTAKYEEEAEPATQMWKLQEPAYSKKKSDFIYAPHQLGPEGRQVIYDRLCKDKEAVMQFEAYGASFKTRGTEKGPYPHTELARISLQYWTNWTDASETAVKEQSMNEWEDELSPFSSGAKYRNYECTRNAKKVGKTYFGGGEGWKRVRAVKKRWDAQSVFGHSVDGSLEEGEASEGEGGEAVADAAVAEKAGAGQTKNEEQKQVKSEGNGEVHEPYTERPTDRVDEEEFTVEGAKEKYGPGAFTV